MAQVIITEAIEWLPENRSELQKLPHAPKHIFGDLESFWLPDIQSTITRIKKKGLAS